MTLTIDNSFSNIGQLDPKQFASLREVLSYLDNPQASYFSNDHMGGKRYLLDKKGNFPTGCLYLVQGWIARQRLEVTTKDLRKVPKRLAGSATYAYPFPPYEAQSQAALACINHHRGIIVAPTGVGKSMIVALIVAALNVRTLIVVPGLELKHQLTASLREIFGSAVGKTIVVENIQALDPKKPAPFDCVIIDEFHHAASKSYRDLNKKAWGGIYYRFGLTATPFRSQEHEKLLLESVLSKVIYQVPYAAAVKSGFIVPMLAYTLTVDRQECETNHWQTCYKQLVVNNEARNRLICATMIAIAPASTLCLVKEIAHGNTLAEMSGVPFANGEDEGSKELIRAFAAGRIPALIATTGVCGEGVDTKAAEHIIIAGLGKSRPAFMQQVGRGFRRWPGKEYCRVWLFLDKSHKWTKAHYKEQVCTLLEEYGVVPEVI